MGVLEKLFVEGPEIQFLERDFAHLFWKLDFAHMIAKKRAGGGSEALSKVLLKLLNAFAKEGS